MVDSTASSLAADVLARFAPQLEHLESLLTDAIDSPKPEATVEANAITDDVDDVAASDLVSSAVREVATTIKLNNPSSLPSSRTLIKLLDKIDHAFDQNSLSTQQLDSLHVTALARITYAAYAIAVDALLTNATSITDEAWYWTQVEESTYNTACFIIQTLPQRIVHLVRTVLEIAAHNTSQTVKSLPGSRDPSNNVSLKQTFSNVLQTPNMVTAILFPYTFHNQASVTLDLVKNQESRIQSAAARKSRSKSLRAAVLEFSPIYLARHEARCKRRGLTHERDLLAEKLGRLALEQEEQAENTIAVQQDMLQDLKQKIAHVAQALSVETPDEREISSVKVQVDSPPTAQALSSSLRVLLTETLERTHSRTALILSPTHFGQPSRLTQRWPSLLAYPCALLLISRYISNNWNGLAAKAQEAKETLRGLLIGWVWEPCVQLLETVRHGGDDAAVIVSRESLNSDLSSLERMVASFTKDQYGITGPELDAVAAKVREGDLTHVLRIYESEMRTPFKSTVSGSLVRALLIQIQKAKVDLEIAMSGIDRLLKSQQLLFGAVGIAPALGVLYVSTSWLRNKLTSAPLRSRSAKALRTRAWEALRRIDRLLAQQATPRNHGLLLLDLALLRDASAPLLRAATQGNRALAKRLHRLFIQDVRDLESTQPQLAKHEPGLGQSTRRAAVERMWRSWGGVLQLEL